MLTPPSSVPKVVAPKFWEQQPDPSPPTRPELPHPQARALPALLSRAPGSTAPEKRRRTPSPASPRCPQESRPPLTSRRAEGTAHSGRPKGAGSRGAGDARPWPARRRAACAAVRLLRHSPRARPGAGGPTLRGSVQLCVVDSAGPERERRTSGALSGPPPGVECSRGSAPRSLPQSSRSAEVREVSAFCLASCL